MAQIQGDRISKEIPESAGILSATAILALTENDQTNLMVGLQAEKLEPEGIDEMLGRGQRGHGCINVL